jgi:hypothetical protein
LARSAAASGATSPAFDTPSVREDRHLRHLARRGQPAHRQGQAIADRGAVLAGLGDQRELARRGDQVGVIEGERAQRVGVAREADQADRVVGPTAQAGATGHELLEHPLDRVEARLFAGALRQIQGAHRARAIDHHHDRDAAALDAVLAVVALRLRQRHDQRQDRHAQERVGHPGQVGPPGRARRQGRQRRELHAAGGPPRQDDHRQHQERAEERPRVRELDAEQRHATSRSRVSSMKSRAAARVANDSSASGR